MKAETETVLVSGFGSIGKRHVRILREMGHKVHVFSRRKLSEEEHFQDIETSLQEVQPEYVVIANETSEHHPALKMVLSYEVPKFWLKNLYFQPH